MHARYFLPVDRSAVHLPWRFSALAILLAGFVLLTSTAVPARAGATFIVNSTGDASDVTPGNAVCATAGAVCTLRAAIEEANALAGADNINFSIGTGVQTISPATALPIIIGAVDINGTTQPGFAGTPIIELEGSAAPAGTNGLRISSGSTTIRGLVINRFARIGASTGGIGIEITGNGSNVITGNYIGTNVAGTSSLSTTGTHGIKIASTSGGNQIGGTTISSRNIVSGNGSTFGHQGIYTTCCGGGNIIQGNYIGTGVAGTENLPNGAAGIWIEAGSDTVGGAAPGAGNLIRNNSYAGVRMQSNGNVVQGNTATTVWVLGGTGNRISQNLLSGLGIDLGPGSGRTLNDVGDGDTGDNTLQNFPVITSGSSTATTTTVIGTFNSTASSTFTLEFFSTAVCSPAGSTTQAYLGSSVQVTDGTGNVAFNVTLPVPVSFGNSVVATATAADGSTSEISDCQTVQVTPIVASQIHDSAHTNVANTTMIAVANVHNSITVSGTGPTPTGTVNWLRYATSDCTAPGSSFANNLPLTAGALETVPQPTAAGLYSYKIHYNGDVNYAPADSSCQALLITADGGFPPVQDDLFRSMGTFKILVAAPFQPMLQTCPIYNTTTAKIQSPVLYDPATRVGRSSAFTQGSVSDTSGVPVGTAGTNVSDSSMPLRPAQFDGPASPRREVHTELRTLNLQGFGAYVRAGTAAARPTSAGEVQSKDNTGTVSSDFPAESFFNVFVEAKIPQCGAATMDLVLYNQDPLLVLNDNLTMFPPKVVYIHGNTNAVEVRFLAPNPGQWNAGDLFGWLILAGHGAGFDPNNPDDVTEFQNVINTQTEMCASTDGDCDGYVGPAATSHQGPRNTNPAVDNCVSVANADQLNNDGNFFDNSPPYAVATDDKTDPYSDALGDPCDSDDDNDGISDATETNLGALQAMCATALAVTDPLKFDSDNDRVADRAECIMGTNPNDITSKPVNPPVAQDPDNDKLSNAIEAIIGTNPNLFDTDGDGANDALEFKGWRSNPLVADTDSDGTRDRCEMGSINADTVVNPGDQALLAAEIVRAVAATSKLPQFDINKDGAYNPGDQALQASMIGAGKCP